MKKIYFIYNPHSGKEQIGSKLNEIIRILAERDNQLTVVPTIGYLDAMERIINLQDDYDLVVCSGGDGTLDEVVTGDKNVSDKCVEILGINANQFKQIVMIAQGEFMELLLAKPKDRAIIFRKIFDTGIYKDISDRLKIKYLELQNY